MAGIYIHIPFCKSKCCYCNFYSVTSVNYLENFVTALLKEIELQHNYLYGESVETIYLGGGTPSLLIYDMLMSIFEKLQKFFDISQNAEITLEANPESLDSKKIKEIKNTPVNRISIGVQSFFNEDLIYLNRIHSASQAESSVKRSQDIGFENISVDLIYGIPTLTNKKWLKSLEFVSSLEIPHISAYSLTVEAETKLSSLINKGILKSIDELQSAEQFKIIIKQLKQKDYAHYEISNFCKKGFISIHNSNYWKGVKYLGLGPSAHSFDLTSRQWNTPDINKYIESVKASEIAAVKEILTEKDKFNEYIMVSLRTMWGCDIVHIGKTFGNELKDLLIEKINKHIAANHILLSENIFTLSDEGKLFADGIISELFI